MFLYCFQVQKHTLSTVNHSKVQKRLASWDFFQQIWGNFQICISVPLTLQNAQTSSQTFNYYIGYLKYQKFWFW